MPSLTAALVAGNHTRLVSLAYPRSPSSLQAMPQEILDKILDELLPHRFIAFWTLEHGVTQGSEPDTARALICTSIYISSSALKKIYSSTSTFIYRYNGEQLIRPLRTQAQDILNLIQNVDFELILGNHDVAAHNANVPRPYENLIKPFSGTATPRIACRINGCKSYTEPGCEGQLCRTLGSLTGFRDLVIKVEEGAFWYSHKLHRPGRLR